MEKVGELVKKQNAATRSDNEKLIVDNALSGKIMKLRKILNMECRDLMRAISPIDEEEKRLQRLIEIKGRARIALHLFIITQQEFNRQNLILDFQDQNKIKEIIENEFRSLFQDLSINFKERVKSRPFLFDPQKDDFIKLDQHIRERLITEYEREVQDVAAPIQEQFLRDIFQMTQFNSLVVYRQQLGVELENLNKQLDSTIDKKTPHGMKYNEAEIRFVNRRKRLQDAIGAQEKDFADSLSELCFQGKINEVQAKLKQDKHLINELNIVGELPLHRACEGGHIDLVRMLLDYEPDLKLLDSREYYKGEQFSAFHYACRQDTPDMLVLLCAKDDFSNFNILSARGRSLLLSAVHAGKIEVVKWLLKQTYSTAPKIFAWATKKEKLDINTRDGLTGGSALHLAAWLGHGEIASLLFQHKIDPHLTNKAGDTALFEAVLYRQVDVIKVFFQNGIYLSEREMQKLSQRNEFPIENQRMFSRALYQAHLEYLDAYLPGFSSKAEIQRTGGYSPAMFKTSPVDDIRSNPAPLQNEGTRSPQTDSEPPII